MLAIDTWSVRKVAVKASYTVTPLYAIRVCVHRTSSQNCVLRARSSCKGFLKGKCSLETCVKILISFPRTLEHNKQEKDQKKKKGGRRGHKTELMPGSLFLHRARVAPSGQKDRLKCFLIPAN